MEHIGWVQSLRNQIYLRPGFVLLRVSQDGHVEGRQEAIQDRAELNADAGKSRPAPVRKID
eukprot:2112399-Pyramimonas_sp.AAC.1